MENTQNTEGKEGKKNGFNTLVILLLLVGIGVMTFLWSSTRSELSESNSQLKTMSSMLSQYSGEISNDMTADLQNMLQTYDALKQKAEEQGDLNEEQAAEIEAQKSQISELLEKVKQGKWTAAELARMRRENETLRNIMKGYVYQIDSLNTLNLQLTTNLKETQTELQTTSTERDQFKAAAEESQERVAKGSVLQAYSFSSTGLKMKLNNTTTETERARNTVQIKSAFTIGANPITTKGSKTVYMQITKPDGTIYQSRTSNVITVGEQTIAYSDKKDIDYQGKAVNLAIYYNLRDEEAPKGNYKIQIFCEGHLIGKDNFTLK